jgi:hypothetical protein
MQRRRKIRRTRDAKSDADRSGQRKTGDARSEQNERKQVILFAPGLSGLTQSFQGSTPRRNRTFATGLRRPSAEAPSAGASVLRTGIEPVIDTLGRCRVRVALELISLEMQATHHGSGFTHNDIALVSHGQYCPPCAHPEMLTTEDGN